MNQSIIHSCGHEQNHFVDGIFAVDVDRMAARLARQRCKQCRDNAMEERAASDFLSLGAIVLARLEGSPKQVVWAEKIRATRLSAVIKTDGCTATRMAEVRDAKWWIEARALSDVQFMASLEAAPMTVSA